MSGCNSVWPECLVWSQDVGGSNPLTLIKEIIMIDYWRLFQGTYCMYAVCGNCSHQMDLEDRADLGLMMEVVPAKCEKCGWVPTKFHPGENNGNS